MTPLDEALWGWVCRRIDLGGLQLQRLSVTQDRRDSMRGYWWAREREWYSSPPLSRCLGWYGGS